MSVSGQRDRLFSLSLFDKCILRAFSSIKYENF